MVQVISQMDQIIIDEFLNQVETGGCTTTLDVKNALVASHPDLPWSQTLVSGTLNLYANQNSNVNFSDNGTYRTYFFTIPTSPKQYTFEVDGIKITGSKEYILDTFSRLDKAVHFSQSKDHFVLLSEIQDNHLFNIIKNQIDDISDEEDLYEFITDNQYVSEFVSRQANLRSSI